MATCLGPLFGMADIHPTAIVDRRAELAGDVSVGAYSIIKAGVTVGPGTVIQEHCHIHGVTVIGSRCRIGPGSFVGLPPQHLKHDGAGTRAIIGNDVVVREGATIHRSIYADAEHATRVGDRVYLMATSHVGHDSQVADDVMLAQGTMLGGHCIIGSKVFIGGGAAVHQFVRIGRIAIIAGNEGVTSDVPPFAAARYQGLKGYNAIGCKRSGMPPPVLHAIRSAYHYIHMNRTLPGAIAAIRANVPMLPEIQEMLDFFAGTKRGIMGSVRGAGLARLGLGKSTGADDSGA
jgi:UDP-N-acetylglucosamine acyltransferase